MQTLRKRSSPCKYKNEPTRFLGEGMTFKAKLIGILEVNEARGDKMCQDALNDLKTAIRAAGEHKQRITISIAIDGLRLRDEKTGDSMYHHPVHKISFIAQDMSDSRAFGYIFGSPDTGHRFFGIKTDKTASQVVIAMRDLFQAVFELKKKEIERTKRHIELHQSQYPSTPETTTKVDVEDKKPKSIEFSKSHQASASAITTRDSASAQSSSKETGAAATSRNTEIADLLDLEDELNSIQQGISQMERITPSDPFGPLSSKGESFLDSFKEKSAEIGKSSALSRRSVSQSSNKDSEGEKSAGFFGSASAASTSSRALFFPPFSPNAPKAKEEDAHWFDQESGSLFTDAMAVAQPPEPSTSPVTFHTPTGEEPVLDDRRSPMKTDLFTDLDPLGTGRVKPYLDKKDFFHELKNPPKKVLKELISEPKKTESGQYFPAEFDSLGNEADGFESSVIKNPLPRSSIIDTLNKNPKYSKIDPFEDMDPFEKSDPFSDDPFPKSSGFSSMSIGKTIVDEKPSRIRSTEDKCFDSPPKNSIFSSSIHGPLRVSLPPEKADNNTTISLSSFASRFRSSPSPTEESKTLRRKHYQALKHSQEDKSDDQSNSPILEEVYVRGSPKPFSANTFEKKISVGSPPPVRIDKFKSKMSSSLELLDSTPDPPPRPRTALFAIKPPPLPPKKQNQPHFRPPARPPSLEENVHYDYLRQRMEQPKPEQTPEIEGSPKRKNSEVKRQKSYDSFSNFPILPRPPQRKTSIDSNSRHSSVTTPTSAMPSSPQKKEPSVLNITLNQLDQAGFESLATTLGIPTENVCNMTLQELTKLLSQKYLGNITTNAESEPSGNVFKADFDTNFSKSASETPNSVSTFDKYAVFKELMNEDKPQVETKDDNISVEDTPVFDKTPKTSISEEKRPEGEDEEEDRYAALRQLSISAQKSDNLSEDFDVSNEEDSSARADNISDIIKHQTDDFTPLHSVETINESPRPLDDIEEVPSRPDDETWTEENEQVAELPADDGYPTTDPLQTAADNWATFDREAAKPVVVNKDERKQNGKEEIMDDNNSPISSDGKEQAKHHWVKGRPKRGAWKDEDESLDDYSAKDSYVSDESSHDGRSPLKESPPAFRKPWSKDLRSSKPTKNWTPQQHRPQNRWVEDTEDEYDDIRRRRRPNWEGRKKNYDGREQSHGWETWGERSSRGYQERRKGGGPEYRRSCDSDGSEKEHLNAERSYREPSSVKQKQYHGYSREQIDRHYSDNRESRSKYKRPTSHKRPSSASDAKRYEKIYSPVDHSMRSPEKRDSEDENYLPKYRINRKDVRYQSNIEHYGSYDRRMQASHQRRMQRGRRGQDDVVTVAGPPRSSEGRRYFPPETPQSAQSEDTPEATKELHFKFEDDFIPSPEDYPATQKAQVKEPPARRVDDWGRRLPRRQISPSIDNNTEQFASFNDDFSQFSPEQVKDTGKNEPIGGAIKKPSLKGRSHLTKLGRQDSSTSLRKSESINIFSRESDPFEDDDFFSSGNSGEVKLGKFYAEKSKSNTNVSDPFAWKGMFVDCKFED